MTAANASLQVANRLTSEITAFDTFAEFVQVMRPYQTQTYVPTVRTHKANGKPIVKAIRLVEILRECGFQVFTGR